jgi:hypothetical protein
LHHKEAVVVKLLQVVLVSVLLLIFQMHAALAQVHHSLDLVVITTQAHQFQQTRFLGSVQPQFNVLAQEIAVPLNLHQMFLQVVQVIQHNVFITTLEHIQHVSLQTAAVVAHRLRLPHHQHLTVLPVH